MHLHELMNYSNSLCFKIVNPSWTKTIETVIGKQNKQFSHYISMSIQVLIDLDTVNTKITVKKMSKASKNAFLKTMDKK